MVLANRTRVQNSRTLLRAFGGLNEGYGCSGLWSGSPEPSYPSLDVYKRQRLWIWRPWVRVPLGTPPKKSAVFNSGLFLCGCPVGLEKHGTAAGRATNSPVGCLLVRGSQPFGTSTGVPHSSCF